MSHLFILLVLSTLSAAPCVSFGSDDKDHGSYWNNGRPSWNDLKRVAGTGQNARVISWENGCYLCEAENDATLTKCYSTVREAKSSGWSNGFSGFHPGVKAWCSPSTSPVDGIRMYLNTSTNSIMLH